MNNLWQVQVSMGYEVDKPSKFFIKISNAAEYIKSNIQVILSSSIYEKTYLQGFLERVLEAIQVLASSDIQMVPV